MSSAAATLGARPAAGWLDRTIERPLPLFLAIFAVFLIVFGASIALVPRRYGQLIVGDGIYYYVYLRSAVMDGDLNFANDYALYQRFNTEDPVKKQEMLSRQTPTGMAANLFSIGPAVLWSPVFLVSYALAGVVGQAGDGFSFWYQAPLLFLSISYGMLGILLMYRVAAGMFSRLAAFIAILAMWLATNVVYYMGVSPSASHVLSLFASALFLWLWWRDRGKRTVRGWFVWGLSAGLMALVRWQDAVIALLALFEWVGAVVEARRGEGKGVAELVGWGAVFAVGALVAFAPQMAAWQILYGAPLTAPQGAGFFQFLRPEILNVWFSTKRGLFTWTPVVLLAVVGFVPLYRRDRRLGAAAAVIFLLETYATAIVNDWWGGEAYGARRFISLMPFFALGLAALVDAARPRVSQGALLALLVVLVGWNELFVLQYTLWLHGIGHISALPTLPEMTVDKFTAPLRALERLRAR